MSNQKVYSGSIAMTKLQSAIITTKKGAKCLLVPIDANYMREVDGAIYMDCNIIVREEQDERGQNGFIAQKLGTDKFKELGADKAKELKLPILGNIKHFANSSNDAGGATEIQGSIDPENDTDLPF